jgi:hypothetical protein
VIGSAEKVQVMAPQDLLREFQASQPLLLNPGKLRTRSTLWVPEQELGLGLPPAALLVQGWAPGLPWRISPRRLIDAVHGITAALVLRKHSLEPTWASMAMQDLHH